MGGYSSAASAMPAPPHSRLGPEDLAALAGKYRTLASLRRRRDGTDEIPAPETLRALSAQHPGCLRELDTLGLGELERRAQAAAAAAAGAPEEPWMAWISAYHRVMAAALQMKGERAARGLSRAPVTDAEAAALAEQASRSASVPFGVALVRAVLRPPRGRLSGVVLAEVARAAGEPVEVVTAALFPSRRGRRPAS
jgi:hypothetical protein